MSIQPQHLLVEEKGLSNQIKRLKDLVPTKEDADLDNFMFTSKYLQERFEMTKEEARDMLSLWMKSYNKNDEYEEEE